MKLNKNYKLLLVGSIKYFTTNLNTKFINHYNLEHFLPSYSAFLFILGLLPIQKNVNSKYD